MKYFVLLFICFSALSYSEADYIEKYEKNYFSQMRPVLRESLRKGIPNITDEQLSLKTDFLGKKMAKCTLKSISHYPKKYFDQSVFPIVKGKSITETNEEMDSLLVQDMESGALGRNELIKMVELAQSNVKSCMKLN